MKLLPTLLMVTCAGLSFPASAQWQWIDKDGHKVFSDRAPPADILDKNILKRPGRAPAATPASAPEGIGGGETPAVPALPQVAKPSTQDKELEAKKKQALDAELAKRKADEERIAKAKIESCTRARQAKVTFDSGVRVGRTNAAGEREIMDEAARAEEIKRIETILTRDCK